MVFALLGAYTENCPSRFVTAILDVPVMMTVAPITGSFFSSMTVPFTIRSCADTPIEYKESMLTKRINVNNFF